MSFTAEPFFLPTEPTVANPLRAAGYTDAAHRQCLAHAVADYAPWKASRLVLSLNPFYGLSGRRPGDAAFTEQVMRACRQAVGRRCVFDNHDLDANPPKTLLPIYAAMQKMGPEIEFQTFARRPKISKAPSGRAFLSVRARSSFGRTTGGFPLVPDATPKRWATRSRIVMAPHGDARQRDKTTVRECLMRRRAVADPLVCAKCFAAK
jgi:hypothetical protein